MSRIRDRVLLGVVSGIISAIPGRIINTIEYHSGLTDRKYGQLAGSLFTDNIRSPQGKLLGSLANQALTAAFGTSVVYTLSATGKDHAALKGAAVGSLYWFGLFGLSNRLGITSKSKKPLTPLLSLVDHIIFGVTNGILAAKLGHASLFPDQLPAEDDEKLPLFSADQTGNETYLH
ncbi:MAG: hypothetical protein SCK29_01995 [Bacillota bacterium]|nr:hypothetical protein [Bacillota bacterium]MDW7682874.1 hypothetical protein [Bacillota bacterium]